MVHPDTDVAAQMNGADCDAEAQSRQELFGFIAPKIWMDVLADFSNYTIVAATYREEPQSIVA